MMVLRVTLEPSIEDVFSSRGRVRILKILVEVGELNITEIARRARLNYSATNRHLVALREMRIIEEKTFGKIRIFSFKSEDPRTRAIKALMDLWHSSTSN